MAASFARVSLVSVVRSYVVRSSHSCRVYRVRPLVDVDNGGAAWLPTNDHCRNVFTTLVLNTATTYALCRRDACRADENRHAAVSLRRLPRPSSEVTPDRSRSRSRYSSRRVSFVFSVRVRPVAGLCRRRSNLAAVGMRRRVSPPTVACRSASQLSAFATAIVLRAIPKRVHFAPDGRPRSFARPIAAARRLPARHVRRFSRPPPPTTPNLLVLPPSIYVS